MGIQNMLRTQYVKYVSSERKNPIYMIDLDLIKCLKQIK